MLFTKLDLSLEGAGRLLTGALLALAGCGGGGGTLGGVDESRPVGTLSHAELTDICTALVAKYPETTEEMCVVLSLGTTPAACEQTLPVCLSSPPAPDQSPVASCVSVYSKYPECTSRVSDLEACYASLIDQFAALTCSSDRSQLGITPACLSFCPSKPDAGP
jgi:hypothetical protein